LKSLPQSDDPLSRNLSHDFYLATACVLLVLNVVEAPNNFALFGLRCCVIDTILAWIRV